MSVLLVLASAGVVFAAVPAAMFLGNLGVYRRLPAEGTGGAVSVLIPARDEEGGIAAAVESVLANQGAEVEVIVLDDHSTDRTAAIVEEIGRRDPRVRLEHAPPLPSGWSGKQHACFVLSGLATHSLLMFLDADVRLAPDAVRRMAAEMGRSGVPLLSGFPRQETRTIMEKLLIPLIHFVLLGFLPMGRMRASASPAYAAGCGQLFVARAEVYRRVGGHGALKESFHDGIRLPRAFREAGERTDLFDATDVARCRMYRDAGAVWRGLAKNAGEGLGSGGMIVPATVVLGVGQVVPFVVAGVCLTRGERGAALWVAVAGCVLAWLPRVVAGVRFRQSGVGAVLHPVGIVLFLMIQWWALWGRVTGRRVAWKGRVQG